MTEQQFFDRGWHPLNCERPFYLRRAYVSDGTVRTVACTPEPAPTGHCEWFWREGRSRARDSSAFVAQDGQWVEQPCPQRRAIRSGRLRR